MHPEEQLKRKGKLKESKEQVGLSWEILDLSVQICDSWQQQLLVSAENAKKTGIAGPYTFP